MINVSAIETGFVQMVLGSSHALHTYFSPRLNIHATADCTCKGSSCLQTACSSVLVFITANTMDESLSHTNVFNYSHNNVYPSDADKKTKNNMRQSAALFELKEGMLFSNGSKRQ